MEDPRAQGTRQALLRLPPALGGLPGDSLPQRPQELRQKAPR